MPRLPTKGLTDFGKTCTQIYKKPAPFKYFLAIPIPSFRSRGEFDALRLLVKARIMQNERIKFFISKQNNELDLHYKTWDRVRSLLY